MRQEIIKVHNGQIDISLHYVVFIEDGEYIANIPSLDVFASGSSSDEAMKHLNETLDLFFEYLIEENTIDLVLAGCGWEKMKKPLYQKAFPAIEELYTDKEVVVSYQDRQFAACN